MTTPPERGRDAAAGSPLLVDRDGYIALLLGNEAIVRGALEAGVAFACGYPGTPSSEVTDTFARIAAARGIEFEYSVNEKVALEMAFAASLAGARSLCAMKHLGLMYAGDPLSTIPYVGTVGGMVIVSAGDPSCHTSPNEQDQRHLGPMLHLVVLDPATPQEACDLTRLAFEISEESRLPVLLRTTTRVAHSRAPVRCRPLAPPRRAGFVRDPARFVPIPQNARKLRLEIPQRLETARRLTAPLFRRTGEARDAIVAGGVPAATCADLLRDAGLEGQVTLATLAALHPLPEAALVDLLRDVDRVLVVEELSPYLEDALRALAARHGIAVPILGKRTGHLPTEFEYEPAVIRRGLHAALGLGDLPPAAPEFAPVPERPPSLCPGCPHRATYFAAREAFGPEQLYFNDIGCYTLGYEPPLAMADALLCMGAGFTLAAGVARVTGQRTVGFLGDSTFFHSGMPALLNAIKERVSMVAVILDNQVTAMTGFQESPASPHVRPDAPPVSIERIVRAMGAEHVETIDPTNLPAALAAFGRARDARGVSVIIAQEPCPVNQMRSADASGRAAPGPAGPERAASGPAAPEGATPGRAAPYRIDHDRCQTCGRASCGMQCDQCVSQPFEANLARARLLDAAHELEAGAGAHTEVAPCATRCPLAICIQGYIGHLAAGQYREALDLILSRNPLPESVCRVCHRPCEEICVHAPAGEPVAVNDLKRFILDWAASQRDFPYEPQRDPDHGRRVAVVGAGPAGLAAAHDLRLRGYAVTLYDAGPEPGGLLVSGIPGFRLPREIVRRDARRILDLGVEFVGDTVLGRDISLDRLLEDGHDAVFLALGAHRALPLRVTNGAGPDGPSVTDALSYLLGSANGSQPPTGRRVVVVGGGNAAIDAARTALRRGAGSVKVAYRRRREEMTALPDEIEAAREEGIEILPQLAPVALEGGTAGGLRCAATEPGDPDASGRRAPVPLPGPGRMLPADQVIVAVGQTADLAFLEPAGPALERAEDGGLRIDPETARTSHPRIFAGGDMVPGPRSVTDAMAWGQRAAWGIDRELRGAEAADRRMPPPRPEHWPWLPPVSGRPRSAAAKRQRPAELDPATRAIGFDEVVATLTEAQARAEALRCSSCGQCGNCRACIDLFGCPAFYLDGGRIHIDPDLCNGCGVCARFCPNRAIVSTDGPPQ